MNLNIIATETQTIAEVISDEIVVNDPQDALDLMVNASYQGAHWIILHEHQLSGDFFELGSGLAGEIVQKFVNYQMKLAIVGEFEKFESKSLQAFMRESNRGQQLFFGPDVASAIRKIRG